MHVYLSRIQQFYYIHQLHRHGERGTCVGSFGRDTSWDTYTRKRIGTMVLNLSRLGIFQFEIKSNGKVVSFPIEKLGRGIGWVARDKWSVYGGNMKVGVSTLYVVLELCVESSSVTYSISCTSRSIEIYRNRSEETIVPYSTRDSQHVNSKDPIPRIYFVSQFPITC